MWVSHGIHAHVGKGKDLIGLTVTAVRLDRKSLPTLSKLFWHFRGPNGVKQKAKGAQRCDCEFGHSKRCKT